jgi:internalin A
MFHARNVLLMGRDRIRLAFYRLAKSACYSDRLLANNQLAALPDAIGRLGRLQTLRLNGNPLTYPPREIVDQGTTAIITFLAAVRADRKSLHEAKVVLVGDPAHGKTALRSWLEHDEFREPGESTRGGEVGFRTIDVGEVKGRINIWDFGGQDRYRPAQQPLFTPGALYLLVCNGRKNILESGVEEWLRLIQLRAGRDARVLLIFSHTKEHDGVPSLTPLRDDLRQMIRHGDVFAIDSPSGFGAPELVKRICEEARALPNFNDVWPGGYVRARDEILALRAGGNGNQRRHYMPYTDFLKVCATYGVMGVAARSLAVALSLQGRLDYKGTEAEPDQLVVLDPEWMLKAIAYVTDDRGVAESGGILHRRELRRIWKDHGRPAKENPVRFEEHLWPHLLELMARHDLVYRLSEDEWVVPQSVPDCVPDPLPWTAKGSAIRLDCKLDYPISGLMAFLTVRNHYKHVKGKRLFWQRGAFLRHPITGAEALITVDGEQTICVETRGHQSDVLIHDLQETLVRLIYDRWPGSKQDEEPPFTFTVPCPTPECRGKYALNVLQAEREAQREDAFCDARRPHRHRVAKLLYGIELPTTIVEIGKLELASRTFGMPPRLLEISTALQKTLNAVQGLTKERVQIQLYCELSEKLVPGAVDVVEMDKDWVAEARRWLPWAAGKLTILRKIDSMPTSDPDYFGDLPKDQDRKVDAAAKSLLGLPKGRLMRSEGQILPGPVADKLIAIANKGNMRQTQLSDGRWVWASKEEADRNDPTIPKEG